VVFGCDLEVAVMDTEQQKPPDIDSISSNTSCVERDLEDWQGNQDIDSIKQIKEFVDLEVKVID